MLYANGKPWDGWKKLLGNLKLKKDAVFMLTDSYSTRKETAEGSGKFVKKYPQLVSVSPEIQYYDEESRETLTIRWAERIGPERSEVKGLITSSRYTPLDLEFNNGALRVKKNHLDLYWLLMNHPANESNPIYEKPEIKAERRAPFVFFEKNEEKELLAEGLKINKEFEAMKLAAGGSLKSRRELYSALGFGDPTAISETKLTVLLTRAAKEDAEKFLSIAKGEDRQIKALINDAIDNGIIRFNKRANVWQWVQGDAAGFCNITPGLSPVPELIKFFKREPGFSDNSFGETYNSIKLAIEGRRENVAQED